MVALQRPKLRGHGTEPQDEDRAAADLDFTTRGIPVQMDRSRGRSTTRAGDIAGVPHPRRSLAEEARDSQVAGAVARAQAGEMEAIRFLYVRFRDDVHGYVRSIVHDPHDAEDVNQQVFVKLIAAIHKYRRSEAPFASWLLAVARNVAFDHLRKRRPIPREELYPAAREADGCDPEVRLGFEQALGALPREHGRVLILRHLVGLTPAEIAEQMCRKESSIHGMHHRARKAIQRELVQGNQAPMVRQGARSGIR